MPLTSRALANYMAADAQIKLEDLVRDARGLSRDSFFLVVESAKEGLRRLQREYSSRLASTETFKNIQDINPAQLSMQQLQKINAAISLSLQDITDGPQRNILQEALRAINSISADLSSLEQYSANLNAALIVLKQFSHDLKVDLDSIKSSITAQQKKYQDFKKACKAQGIWKTVSQPTTAPVHLAYTKVSVDTTKNTNPAERFNVVKTSYYSSFSGNTLLTDTSAAKQTPLLVLDADYQSGAAGATADGLGELSSSHENLLIARAAHFATKYLVLEADRYDTPEALYRNAKLVLQKAGAEVRAKFLPEETGYVAGAVFTKAYYCGPQKIRVVAGGVGDAMVVVWNPQKSTVSTLLPARQFLNAHQFNPRSLSDTDLPPEALQRNQLEVSEGSVVLRMTDGIWELFPSITRHSSTMLETQANEAAYSQLFLSFYADFKAKHDKEPGAKDYQEFFLKLVQEKVKARDQALNGQEGLITSLQMALASVVPDTTLREFLANAEESVTQKLLAYLEMFGYVMNQTTTDKLTIGELATTLNQPWEIGDDATCGIHVVTYESCARVKPSLSRPLELLRAAFLS